MENFEEIPDDLDLHKTFEIIISREHFSKHVTEIVKQIQQNKLSGASLKNILIKYKIGKITELKEEFLDLILAYINIILNDNALTQKELYNVKFLKKIFQIKEQDFYKYRYSAMREVLRKQLMLIYRDDNRIDREESLYKVGLQELFSISYDQFLEFANEEDFIALYKGADIANLDTVIRNSKRKKNK